MVCGVARALPRPRPHPLAECLSASGLLFVILPGRGSVLSRGCRSAGGSGGWSTEWWDGGDRGSLTAVPGRNRRAGQADVPEWTAAASGRG